MRKRLGVGSNEIETSDAHHEKVARPRLSTDDGSRISLNPVPRNAFGSICTNLDFRSNVSDTSELHLEKQP
jgi:hypothetical protein